LILVFLEDECRLAALKSNGCDFLFGLLTVLDFHRVHFADISNDGMGGMIIGELKMPIASDE